MNHHRQFSVDGDIYITFQIIPECKGQRRGSNLINKISIFSIVTLAKTLFLYLITHYSNSNIGKEKGRRCSKQGRACVVAIVTMFLVATPAYYIKTLS